jgi:hypothetical protein
MRNPNPESERRSKERPAIHTLKNAATSDATPPTARKKAGEPKRLWVVVPPRTAPPDGANVANAMVPKMLEPMRKATYWNTSRQKARGRPSRSLKNGFITSSRNL